jgi:Fe-S-cluster-containing dehydrogenase component/formate-dependent nitrite reductase membrane component NrfD
MNYGFVINNKTCIGCHACSTACKSENDVPLGVYRTWVKYVEKGEFPNSRRVFQVTRCNHCANPPCVRICPVTAMYQRHDGIVEFDPEVCIGCKACMQACPYDAIYIDPDTHSAAKCHYCSHRTDIGLEPACAVVCPTHSIIAGDLDDPRSEISLVLAREQVSVRKPEQGTSPNVFYVEGDDVALTPTASQANFMWADQISEQNVHQNGHHHNGHTGYHTPATIPTYTKKASSGTPIRTPQAQGVGYGGDRPIHIGEGRMAEHMVQTGYNAQHKVPWHWPVPAYLVTKGIGAGVFALLAIFFGFNLVDFSAPLALAGNFVALAFIGITTLFLVIDLEKPHTFLRIVLRPQLKSWLARGAFILMSFSGLAGLWFVLEGAAFMGWLDAGLVAAVRSPLLIIGLVLAIGSAVYTAFLFGQAEGRDLWQSTLLPAHLVIQALMVGSGVLLSLGLFVEMPGSMASALVWIFGISLLADLFVTLLGEFGMPHASEIAARAAHEISHGKYKNHFWWGAIVGGHLVPLALLIVAALGGSISFALVAIAAIAAIVGLYLFEHAFVMAPQEVPNS